MNFVHNYVKHIIVCCFSNFSFRHNSLFTAFSKSHYSNFHIYRKKIEYFHGISVEISSENYTKICNIFVRKNYLVHDFVEWFLSTDRSTLSISYVFYKIPHLLYRKKAFNQSMYYKHVLID